VNQELHAVKLRVLNERIEYMSQIAIGHGQATARHVGLLGLKHPIHSNSSIDIVIELGHSCTYRHARLVR
jgi:hypothetical protein